MTKKLKDKIKKDIENRISNYKDIISTSILESANKIVEVGDILTLSTDENNRTILVNTHYPTQFTDKSVAQILTMTFRNHNNEVIKPQIYMAKDWYRKRLDELNSVLSDLFGVNN